MSGTHHNALRQLTPRCFPASGNNDKILSVYGAQLDLVFAAIEELVREIVTKTTRVPAESVYGLVEYWESDFGVTPLPAATPQERRNTLTAFKNATGGLNKAAFEAIARGFGYNIDSSTDPHLRLSDGDYPPARADYAQADISQVWDQDGTASMFTWVVYGTNVSTDSVLQAIFNNNKAAGTVIVFINE